MSATVLDLTMRLAHRPSRAALASDRTAAALVRFGIPHTLVCQAQARAARNVSAGTSIDEAVRRVVAWARAQLPPPLPPAA